MQFTSLDHILILGLTAFLADNGRWLEYELRLQCGEGLRGDWPRLLARADPHVLMNGEWI